MTYLYNNRQYDYLKEAVQDAWDDLNPYDAMNIWNDFCDANNDSDSRIYEMGEFDDLYRGKSPSEIADLIEGNNFSIRDDFFREGIYGIESSDHPKDDFMDFFDIEDYLMDNLDDLDIEEQDDEDEE